MCAVELHKRTYVDWRRQDCGGRGHCLGTRRPKVDAPDGDDGERNAQRAGKGHHERKEQLVQGNPVRHRACMHTPGTYVSLGRGVSRYRSNCAPTGVRIHAHRWAS